MMEGPYKKYFDALVRLFPLLMPEIFRCEKAASIPEGHIYLSIFQNELFLLADYLIETTESPLLDGVNLKIENVLNKEDLAYLKNILCRHSKSKETEVSAKAQEYMSKLFPGESCIE